MSAVPGSERHEHRVQAPKVSWKSKSRALADDAAEAALRVPGVLYAEFTISGPPAELVLRGDLTFQPNVDASATLKLITDSVIGDLERAIGIRFAAQHVDFHVAEFYPEFQAAATADPPVFIAS